MKTTKKTVKTAVKKKTVPAAKAKPAIKKSKPAVSASRTSNLKTILSAGASAGLKPLTMPASAAPLNPQPRARQGAWSANDIRPASNSHHFGRLFWGLLILLIGLLYLGQNWGILPFNFHLTFNQVWPFVLIFIGLCFLNRRSRLSILVGVIGAAAFVAVAVFLIAFANNQYDYTVDFSMPILRHVEKAPVNATTTPAAADSLKLDNVTANQVVSSPLTITGQAKGGWFFEGTFPIRIVDENQTELGRTQAKAIGDWTTTNPVNFFADLTFKKTTSTQGIIIFERDNPSGLPQNAEQYMVPVKF